MASDAKLRLVAAVSIAILFNVSKVAIRRALIFETVKGSAYPLLRITDKLINGVSVAGLSDKAYVGVTLSKLLGPVAVAILLTLLLVAVSTLRLIHYVG